MRTPVPAQSVYFGDPSLPAFGWWHAPGQASEAAERLPVLLCPPFGRDDECAHRTLRVLAERLAAAGHPVLRFDLPGTGDSAGDAHTSDLVPAWRHAVASALDTLLARSGGGAAAVVGLRLGALLAAQVAAEREDVAAFVAIAPPPSGRAFVREFKAFQATSSPVGRADASAGHLEAGGHVLTASTREALAGLDPAGLVRPPAPRMLVIDRGDLASAPVWTSGFAALGAVVDHERHDGFAEMMLDPHLGQVPQAMLAATLAWLARQPAGPAEPGSPTDVQSPARVAAGVVEEPLWIAHAQARMFAILARAAQPTAPRRVVLIVNSGAQRRTGPGRLHVMLARRWAARGMAVLRLDLPGLGDAAARPGEPDNTVYPATAVADLRAVLGHVNERWPGVPCHVLGICSGGYHALQLVREGAALAGVTVLNPLTFDWPGDRPLLEPLPAHKVAQETARYRRSVASLESWRKLLRGDVRVAGIAALLLKRAGQSLASAGREVARLLRLPLRDDLALELARATAKGGVVHFVFSDDEPGEDMLRGQAGRAVGRLERAGRLALHRVVDADHTFTGEGARERVAALMDTVLEAGARPVADLPGPRPVEVSGRLASAVETGPEARVD